MKLHRSSVAGLLFLFLVFQVGFSEDHVDPAGTWEGTIYLAGIDIDMEIALVLTENEGILTGHITDDWGYLDCDITDPVLKDTVLTFKAMVETAQDDHQMAFRMNIAGDKMTGQWESLGSYGEWTLTRKKDGETGKEKIFEIEDILGTWKGPAAYKSDPGSKNNLTLVLEEREGRLAGTFSDQFGTDYAQVHIKKFQDNTLTLEITFLWSGDNIVMDIDAAIKDDSHLRGKFKIDKMGRTGIWTAEKQKDK